MTNTEPKRPPHPASLGGRILEALPATSLQLAESLGIDAGKVQTALSRLMMSGRVYMMGAVVGDSKKLLTLWGRTPE